MERNINPEINLAEKWIQLDKKSQNSDNPENDDSLESCLAGIKDGKNHLAACLFFFKNQQCSDMSRETALSAIGNVLGPRKMVPICKRYVRLEIESSLRIRAVSALGMIYFGAKANDMETFWEGHRLCGQIDQECLSKYETWEGYRQSRSAYQKMTD